MIDDVPLGQGQQQIDGGRVVVFEASWYLFTTTLVALNNLTNQLIQGARHSHALVKVVQDETDSGLQGLVVAEGLGAHLTREESNQRNRMRGIE